MGLLGLASVTSPEAKEINLDLASGNHGNGSIASVAASGTGSSRPLTTIVGRNDFEAYANGGEYVSVSVKIAFEAVNAGGHLANPYRMTMIAPNGATWNVDIPASATVGSTYSILNKTAAASGVWLVSIKPTVTTDDPDTLPSGRMFHALNWSVDVTGAPNGVNRKNGRVWTRKLSIWNNNGGSLNILRDGRDTIDVHYLSDDGWLYRVIYKNYNGVYSRLSAGKRGIVGPTGVPYYGSVWNGSTTYTSEQTTDQYKLFFESPDPSMPENPITWRGNGDREPLNHMANPKMPQISNLQFAPDAGASTHAGTLTWDIADHAGAVDVIFDSNGNGVIDGPNVDTRRTLRSTTTSYHWNGRAPDNTLVPTDQPVKMWVQVGKVGEIHFINSDVEVRAGVSARLMNGTGIPADSRDRIYWDDSGLSTGPENTSVTSDLECLEGCSSWLLANGVHNLPVGSPDHMTGWGNNRLINDWMYAHLTVEESVEAAALEADLKIVKLSPGTPVPGGDAVYTIRVRNDGTLPATSVVVDDQIPSQAATGSGYFSAPTKGSIPAGNQDRWNVGTVDPGETVEATFTVPVPIGATGTMVNRVTVTSPEDPYTGGTQNNSTIGADTDNYDAVSDALAGPDLRIDKQTTSHADGHGTTTGETVTWSITVRNDGTGTATNVQVRERNIANISGLAYGTPPVGTVSGLNWNVGDLAPGAQHTIQISGTVSDNTVATRNWATVGADNALPSPATNFNTCSENDGVANDDDQCDRVRIEFAPDPVSITLDKSAGPLEHGGPNDGYYGAGDLLPTSYVVTNTSDVVLTDIVLTDPKGGTVVCPLTVLDPDESMTCTGEHTLTNSDKADGQVVGPAVVTGTGPVGQQATANDSTTTPIPGITLVKTGTDVLDTDGSGVDSAGDTIDYEFLVTNVGNSDLTDVGVDDPKVGTVACPDTDLSVGDAMTCTATYVLTQADVDSGEVPNTARADGMADGSLHVWDDSEFDVPVTQSPRISLSKVADTGFFDAASDEIAYTFTITNTGNVTLSDVSLTDAMLGMADVVCGGVTELAPRASTNCTVTYTTTQADVDAGGVDNTASVEGTPPGASADPVTDTDDATTPYTPTPPAPPAPVHTSTGI